MTPKQLLMLLDRHRLELVHREMTAAYSTSAIVNFSQFRPEEGVSPLDYMPSYKGSRKQTTDYSHLSDEELDRMTEYSIASAELAVELRAKYVN